MSHCSSGKHHPKSVCPSLEHCCPSWAQFAHKPACNATFWSLMPRKTGFADRTDIHLPFHFGFLTPKYHPPVQLSLQQLPNRSSRLWEFLHLSFTSQCGPKILGTTIRAWTLFQDNCTRGKSLTFTLFIPIFNFLAVWNPQNLSHCFRPKAHPGRGKTKPPWKLFTAMQHPLKVLRDSSARIPSEDSKLKKEINWRGWAGEGKAYQVFIHPKPGASRAGGLEVPRSWLGSIQHFQNALGPKRTDTRDNRKAPGLSSSLVSEANLGVAFLGNFSTVLAKSFTGFSRNDLLCLKNPQSAQTK